MKKTMWEKSLSSSQETITAAEHREVFLSSSKRSEVNAVMDNVMATIQRFKEEHFKSNKEVWKDIQDLIKAVENLTRQTGNQMKSATHESVGASQPR